MDNHSKLFKAIRQDNDLKTEYYRTETMQYFWHNKALFVSRAVSVNFLWWGKMLGIELRYGFTKSKITKLHTQPCFCELLEKERQIGEQRDKEMESKLAIKKKDSYVVEIWATSKKAKSRRFALMILIP